MLGVVEVLFRKDWEAMLDVRNSWNACRGWYDDFGEVEEDPFGRVVRIDQDRVQQWLFAWGLWLCDEVVLPGEVTGEQEILDLGSVVEFRCGTEGETYQKTDISGI